MAGVRSVEPQLEPDTVESDDKNSEAIGWRETLPAAELCCWVALVLMLLMRWINGAQVSADQSYMQITLVVTATMGAIALRLANWIRSRSV